MKLVESWLLKNELENNPRTSRKKINLIAWPNYFVSVSFLTISMQWHWISEGRLYFFMTCCMSCPVETFSRSMLSLQPSYQSWSILRAMVKICMLGSGYGHHLPSPLSTHRSSSQDAGGKSLDSKMPVSELTTQVPSSEASSSSVEGWVGKNGAPQKNNLIFTRLQEHQEHVLHQSNINQSCLWPYDFCPTFPGCALCFYFRIYSTMARSTGSTALVSIHFCPNSHLWVFKNWRNGFGPEKWEKRRDFDIMPSNWKSQSEIFTLLKTCKHFDICLPVS